jgi:hypothetical protein
MPLPYWSARKQGREVKMPLIRVLILVEVSRLPFFLCPVPRALLYREYDFGPRMLSACIYRIMRHREPFPSRFREPSEKAAKKKDPSLPPDGRLKPEVN